jgi:hypothetical protein
MSGKRLRLRRDPKLPPRSGGSSSGTAKRFRCF